jgi:hypothetical protein
MTNPDIKAQLAESRDKFALPPDAIAGVVKMWKSLNWALRLLT